MKLLRGESVGLIKMLGYVELCYTLKSDYGQRYAIVAVDGTTASSFTTLAKEKLCKRLGLSEEDVLILGKDLLGSSLDIIL